MFKIAARESRQESSGSFRWLARIHSFLRCTSCRFTCYYFLAFYCGLGSAARASWIAFGVLYWLLHSSVTEALNRVADQRIDEVNRPERTAVCHQIGYHELRVAARCGYVLLILCGGVWLTWVPTLLVAGLLIVADFLLYNYSFGLRLSRSRFASVAVLAFPFVGTFCGGWALAHRQLDGSSWHEFVFHSAPVLLVGGLLLASLSWVKDVTDMAGDDLIGYRSGWLAMVRGRAAVAGAAVASVPYVALAILTGVGALAPRYWALTALLPAALLLANGTRLATGQREQMAVREFFYNYWMVALAGLTMLTVPTMTGIVVSVLCLLCWRAATLFLHWTSDTSTAWFPAVLRLSLAPAVSQVRPTP